MIQAQEVLTTLLTWVNSHRAPGMPVCVMDTLPSKGRGLSLQMVQVPRWAKRYIDGTGIMQATFAIMAQVVGEDQLVAFDWLAKIGMEVAALQDVDITPDLHVLGATVSMPSIVARSPDGTVRYAISCTINF